MPGRLELRRWIQLHKKGYAVAHSHDGQYVAAGTETGLEIYSLGGRQLGRYPATESEEMPVHQVCATPDFAQIVLATRLGGLAKLELEHGAGNMEVEAHPFPTQLPDVYKMAFSAEKKHTAVGHLSCTLTVLNEEGEVLWQLQDVAAAALGSIWSVAFAPKGTKLYAGNAGGETYWLVALDAATGAQLHRRECSAPVVGVAALPDRLGVAVLSPGEYYTQAHLRAYTPDLADVLWEQPVDSPAVAISVDEQEPVVAVGAGIEGNVTLFHAESGAIMATEALQSMVDGMALAQGRFVAVITQDGSVGLLRYLP